MPLLDEQGKPVPPTNGHNHNDPGEGMAVADVRTVPTGTLIFNLIRFAGEEIGLDNAVHQFERAKEQQKMIEDPPQLVKLRDMHAASVAHRTIVARELNERFKDIDKARMDAFDLQPPAPPVPEAPPEAPPSDDKTS